QPHTATLSPCVDSCLGDTCSGSKMKSHYTYLNIPDNVKTELKKLQNTLKDESYALGLQKVNLDNAHITLSVLTLSSERRKQTEEELINSTNKLLDSIKPKLDISFGGLRCFGARVLYVAVNETSQLLDLKHEVEELLQKEGIKVDVPRFTPHVTLFRLKTGKAGSEGLLKSLASNAPIPSLKSFTATKVFFEALRNQEEKL
ncbi:hypothetical protein OTU49_008166, partial [Cherax quadricarinatus]